MHVAQLSLVVAYDGVHQRKQPSPDSCTGPLQQLSLIFCERSVWLPDMAQKKVSELSEKPEIHDEGEIDPGLHQLAMAKSECLKNLC